MRGARQVHLADVLRLRTRPAAGLLLALTDRCPLSCAHCATGSWPGAPQGDAAPFLRLAGTFRRDERPELLWMSGGEPLLRPALVAELAARARAVGATSAVLSGMYFARGGRLPARVRQACAGLDHFSASMDAFHERQVPRADVLDALGRLLDLVPAVSVHLTAAEDGYPAAVLAELRRRFGRRVPALVTRLQPTGRAAALAGATGHAAAAPTAGDDRGNGGGVAPGSAAGAAGAVALAGGAAGAGGADPCEFALWPLVDTDGTVFACSRQSLARRHRPPHLVLGHAARDGWGELRRRALGDPVLRAVRALGPLEAARRAGAAGCADYCGTCVALTGAPGVSPAFATAVETLLGRTRPRDLAARWGAGHFRDAVELGWEGP
ncbi:radical SAM protein [Streptomyces hoynatensis]|uniref:radical SAM protein n=1 Tax=Streptomyces hoynatensis TaxID=1141874 RepID=UPI00131A45A4|nr:radical SAM protein [Streptomyces hoynatensis]